MPTGGGESVIGDQGAFVAAANAAAERVNVADRIKATTGTFRRGFLEDIVAEDDDAYDRVQHVVVPPDAASKVVVYGVLADWADGELL